MIRFNSLVATLATAAMPALAMVQVQPILLVNLLELSGPIASAGTNEAPAVLRP